MIAATKMRKGHDFHKDKDVGKFVKPWGPRGKIPMCLLPLLIPTTFIKKGCWWLRQLMVLGVGWQDYQSSPTCTLHPLLTSLWQEKPSRTLQFVTSRFCCSSPRVAKHPVTTILRPPSRFSTSRTSNFRVLPVVRSSTDKNRAVFPHAGPPLSVHSSQGRIVFHAQDSFLF